MDRVVTASLEINVEAAARLALQVGVAHPGSYPADEAVEMSLDGAEVPWKELATSHGGRIWLVDSKPGLVRIDYRASLSGEAPAPTARADDELTYLRPSRYCQSDRLAGFASRTFAGVADPHDLVGAVSSWVGTHLNYVTGSSDVTDGAIDTLLAGQGVCRDFAHLTVALLRAVEVPARLAAVYAPGLQPMDFHAVAEACIDGVWYVVDSTLLAPRRSLVRIATGRDAADTSFLSSYGGPVGLSTMAVTATVAGALPTDDIRELVPLR